MVKITNNSDASFVLKNASEFTFHLNTDLIEVPPLSSITLNVKTLEKKSSISIPFEVLNAHTGPGKHPEINLSSKCKDYINDKGLIVPK